MQNLIMYGYNSEVENLPQEPCVCDLLFLKSLKLLTINSRCKLASFFSLTDGQTAIKYQVLISL